MVHHPQRLTLTGQLGGEPDLPLAGGSSPVQLVAEGGGGGVAGPGVSPPLGGEGGAPHVESLGGHEVPGRGEEAEGDGALVVGQVAVLDGDLGPELVRNVLNLRMPPHLKLQI